MHPNEQHYMDCFTVREKIETARALYERHGDALAKDPGVCNLRKSLDVRIAVTNKLMVDLGVYAECKYCEEEEGGSCCGAGIENKYNPILLLANLVLGRSLPDARHCTDSCYFLGKNGCLLKVRHVLCVNYLCRKIQNALMPENLRRLQHAIGEELDTVFLFHERIKKLVGS
jgi:hypothetical protein